MIEYDTFIYLDVYRTGSTHLLRLMEQIHPAPPLKSFRHASLTKGLPLGFTAKPVITTVRNPWDWYVSLWAYGCDGHSAVRRHLSSVFKGRDLETLYDKAEAEASFRRWLAAVHDPAILNAAMKEHLPQSGLAGAIGLYTYRFQRVTTRYPKLLLRWPFIRSPGGALPYHKLMKAYGTVLRNETLSQDFTDFVARHPSGFHPEAAAMIAAADARPANASGRSLPGYRSYYRDADAALVANRDRFFIDAFGYAF